MDTKQHRGQSKEFRFALEVLEERAHLGLDDGYATAIRAILLRRIAESEDDASSGALFRTSRSHLPPFISSAG